MKLSIFPKAKALPSKEEKNIEARFSSKPHLPEIKTFATEDDLIEIICSNCWSPFIFDGYRKQENFVSTDLAVLDIDEGMTIEEAEDIVKSLDITCLCLPTTSHTKEHHKFRLIFPLLKTIKCKEVFAATMQKIGEYFPYDPACLTDVARFYFGSTMNDGFFFESNLLEPVRPEKPKNSPRRAFDSKDIVEVGEDIEELIEALFEEPRKKIPENVAYWLENLPTGMPGEWNNSCNSAIFTLGLMNVPIENVENVFRQLAPDDLDQHDEYLLERAWQDGNNSREELDSNEGL